PGRIPHHPARNSRGSHLRGQHMGTSPRHPHHGHTSTHRHSLGRRFNPTMVKPATTRYVGPQTQSPSKHNTYGVPRLDTTQITHFIIGGSCILGFAATVYQTRQKSSNDTAHTEVEAAAQESADLGAFTDRIQKYMDYQDGQIQKLRSEITEWKDDRTYDREHIRVLQRQIYAGIGPPPLKPGEWPDDEVGG